MFSILFKIVYLFFSSYIFLNLGILEGIYFLVLNGKFTYFLFLISKMIFRRDFYERLSNIYLQCCLESVVSIFMFAIRNIFSLRTRFSQVRNIKVMVNCFLVGEKSDEGFLLFKVFVLH